MRLTLAEYADSLIPGYHVGDASSPVRELAPCTVVGVFDDVTDARAAVPRLEDIVGDGSNTGVVTLGTDTRDDTRRYQPDPEGATGFVFRRIVLGWILGGVIGGALMAAAVYLTTSNVTAAVVTAAGGFLILGVVGALLVGFTGFGASDAFRQTFQPEPPAATVVAAFLPDGADPAPASDLLRSHGARRVHVVDHEGHART